MNGVPVFKTRRLQNQFKAGVGYQKEEKRADEWKVIERWHRIRVLPAVQICPAYVVSNYQPFQFQELQALFWPTYTHRCVDNTNTFMSTHTKVQKP